MRNRSVGSLQASGVRYGRRRGSGCAALRDGARASRRGPVPMKGLPVSFLLGIRVCVSAVSFSIDPRVRHWFPRRFRLCAFLWSALSLSAVSLFPRAIYWRWFREAGRKSKGGKVGRTNGRALVVVCGGGRKKTPAPPNAPREFIAKRRPPRRRLARRLRDFPEFFPGRYA